MTRAELAQQPCPMGGTHKLTQPVRWIGASCWKCHRTWEGTGLVPTWPDQSPPKESEMLCFRDMTFCSAGDRCATPNCYRRFTAKDREDARRWWGSGGDGEEAPVAYADFTGRGCFSPPAQPASGDVGGDQLK